MARGSPAPGQALRLGLATQRFRERDDLPLAPGVRHGRFGRWAAGAGRARRGGRVRGGIREARGRTPGRPCALRGPMIVLGYFIAVVVRPVIAITGAAWQVIGLRVVDRLGEGLRTPAAD